MDSIVFLYVYIRENTFPSRQPRSSQQTWTPILWFMKSIPRWMSPISPGLRVANGPVNEQQLQPIFQVMGPILVPIYLKYVGLLLLQCYEGKGVKKIFRVSITDIFPSPKFCPFVLLPSLVSLLGCYTCSVDRICPIFWTFPGAWFIINNSVFHNQLQIPGDVEPCYMRYRSEELGFGCLGSTEFGKICVAL